MEKLKQLKLLIFFLVITVIPFSFFMALEIIYSVTSFNNVTAVSGIYWGILTAAIPITVATLLSSFGQYGASLRVVIIQTAGIVLNKSIDNTLISGSFCLLFTLFLLVGGAIILIKFSQDGFKLSQNKLGLSTKKVGLINILPEEYIGELEAMQKRWKKQNLSEKEIKLRTFFCMLNMIRGYLLCTIENLWLNRNSLD